jgi:histidinol-phosphatase (PHP family)
LRAVLTDYHMHLQPDGAPARDAAAPRCNADGGHLAKAWIARYVARAEARAVSEIAITEHVHRFSEARDWLDNPWWREEATEDVDAYIAALVDARAQGLPVLVGVEMDWLADRRDEIAAFLDGRPFDLVLGSVHWLAGRGVDHPGYPVWDDLPAERVWGDYLDALVAAARSGLFDVLAHPDLPKVFGHRIPQALEGALEEAVQAIAETGIAIECSSAGLRKPITELYPEPALLGRFRAAGVPVTLASDAHAPEDVARDYPTAVAALRGAGYETITRFAGREPTQVALRWG